MQYDDIGKFIKQKREQLGITQGAFAIENDIDPAVLCRIERLQQGIKLNVLAKIAHGFNLSGSDLLKEYENKFKS